LKSGQLFAQVSVVCFSVFHFP